MQKSTFTLKIDKKSQEKNTEKKNQKKNTQNGFIHHFYCGIDVLYCYNHLNNYS